MRNIIIATIKEWNIKNYFKLKESLSSEYNFHLITNVDELNFQNISQLKPQYIFFPHWSHKIEKEIYENFESIIFHETALPFGRGGSPIQNLIIKKHYKTKISAIMCSEILDSGDIYLQEDYDLSGGSAQKIYEEISQMVFSKMIPDILKKRPEPYKQEGKITYFKRRQEIESNLETLTEFSLVNIYDFIRMLDAKSYPHAFVQVGEYKIQFNDVEIENNKLTGKFTIDEKK